MRLENDYYKLLSKHREGTTGMFHVQLLADCDVYKGHFPGHPVCPGVFHIQMVKEFAQQLVGAPLRISCVRRCRLLAVATPTTTPRLDVKVEIIPMADDAAARQRGFTVCATVTSQGKTYAEIKEEMTA